MYPQPTQDRFWAKVDKSGECWEWRASCGKGGYGHFWFEGRYQSAHRMSYEWERGPIPEMLTLDHLCRNRSCVRPSHLEPVTMRENLLRGNTFQARNVAKTECIRGHPFDAENTGIDSRGRRFCRACMTMHWRAYEQRRGPRRRRTG